MSDCPVCNDELDDGYCHTCLHDLYDEPEWFMKQAQLEIRDLKRAKKRLIKHQRNSLIREEIMLVALEDIEAGRGDPKTTALEAIRKVR